MASIQEISQVAYNQLFPNAGDDADVTVDEFIVTAKVEYAYQMWLKARQEKANEGSYNIPSNILAEKTLPVVDDEMDISSLNILRSIPEEKWLQNIGGLQCGCSYVKSDVNKIALLCDDDSLDDAALLYYVVGNTIKFPKGVHKQQLPIIYATSGEDLDGDMEIDDAIAGVVRSRLIEIYAGKTGQDDTTNNTNPDM